MNENIQAANEAAINASNNAEKSAEVAGKAAKKLACWIDYLFTSDRLSTRN